MTAELIATSREEVAPIEAEPDDIGRYVSPVADRLDERHRLAAEAHTREALANVKAMFAEAAVRRCGSIAPTLR